jgi:hypothetical protein
MRKNRENKWREERPLRDDCGRPRNIRRRDIDDEVAATSPLKFDMVTIVAHDGTLKLVPKAYADLIAARRAAMAKHEADMTFAYGKLAEKMEERMRGVGFGSAASFRSGARDWGQWQGTTCRHDKQILSCNECKPDRPLRFLRGGTGRHGGIKGRETA